jgi:hypothetical protein
MWTLSQLKSLVGGFSPRIPGLSPSAIHVGLVMDNVTVNENYFPVFRVFVRHHFAIAPLCHPGIVS